MTNRDKSPGLRMLKSVHMLSNRNADNNRSNKNTQFGRRASPRFGPDTQQPPTAERIKLSPASLGKIVSSGYDSLGETDKTVVLEYIKEIKFFKKQYVEMERSGVETNSPVAVYDEAILDIVKSCKFIGYQQGDLIFHKGAVGDNMYIILDGNQFQFFRYKLTLGRRGIDLYPEVRRGARNRTRVSGKNFERHGKARQVAPETDDPSRGIHRKEVFPIKNKNLATQKKWSVA